MARLGALSVKGRTGSTVAVWVSIETNCVKPRRISSKLPCQEFLADEAGNLKAIADRQIPCLRESGGQDGCLAALKVLDGLFADGQYAIVRALGVRLDGLEDIGVVAARQTAGHPR